MSAEGSRAETATVRPDPALPPVVLLATRSPHKVGEIRELLSEVAIDFVSLSELGVAATPEEDELERYETFVENARAKARYFHRRTGLPTVADDSGLRVDALDGAPGVRTKRFAPQELADRYGRDEANNLFLLQRLDGVLSAERGAHYRCAIVAIDARGEFQADGTVYGRIAEARRGSGGFGYDPLFELPAYGRTYGELPEDVKRATSHRSRAARQLVGWLNELVVQERA